jgi:TonB-dependent starch-binding outer membrane protein SusC
MNKILLMVMLMMALLGNAWAQTKQVVGKVTSAADDAPLPGVTVVEKGTANGISTGIDGEFALTVSENAVLVFSFIGMSQQELSSSGKTYLVVQMRPDDKQLGEVVVVGYGTQGRRELTGSIASVTAREIENIPVNSFEQALQGRTPGVYINSGSGKLGQGVQIRVRGAASVTASNQPLFVIDGIPVTSHDLSSGVEALNPMADINPADIESFEILKDASAAAIYGSRASNGVVLITTKKGRAGKTKINANFFTGVSQPTRLRGFLNAEEYATLYTEAAINAARFELGLGYYDTEEEAVDDWLNNPGYGLYPMFDSWNPNWRNLKEGTDWEKEAFQKGGINQYELSASGGNEKTRFYISGNHSDQVGILLGNTFQRSTARVNLDHSVNERLRIGTNISLIRTVNQRAPSDVSFTNPLQLVALPPLQPKFDLDDPTRLNRNTIYYNNLIELDNATNEATTYRTISNFYASYDILPSLIFRTEWGVDFVNLEEAIWRGRLTNDGAPGGYGFNRQARALNYTTNNTFTWNKVLADIHALEVMGGMSFQEYSNTAVSTAGRNFPSDDFKRLVSAAQITSGSNTWTGYSFLSYLSRVNYKLLNRYLLTVSARVDGSSRFGVNRRYGVFPAASVGWILSEEEFFANMGFLNFLKVRGSYGLTGNAEIGNFQSRGLYNAIFYGNQAGIGPSSLPNPNLTWETTRTADVAVDFGLWNNRVSGSVDYYERNTTDLLLAAPLPGTSGFTTNTRNVGSLQNKGIEFVVNTENLRGGAFTWTTSFNIARNRNIVTELSGDPIFPGGESLGRVEAGFPLGFFYGVKFAGADQETGEALFYKEDGTTTTTYSEAHRQQIGDPNPKYIGGMDNRFSFKGFDLNILLQFVTGNDVYNSAGIWQSASAVYEDNQTKDQLNRWQKPGDRTSVPAARYIYGNGAPEPSSRWVYDGSFLRVKALNLTYNVPASLVAIAGLETARVYLAGHNLFTFTKYPGYDPEVNSLIYGVNSIQLGHDFYTPPLQRTITVGVTIGF